MTMKMIKNIIGMAMVALAAIATTACEGSNPSEPEQTTISLSVDVENITSTSAKIKVSHDGRMSDSWYGFVTTDVATNEMALINAAVKELKDKGIESELKFSKNYVTVLNTLTPNTAYKYIAFGITEDGIVYGNHGSVEFTTLEGGNDNPGGDGGNDSGEDEVYSGMNVNPSWSIAYTGAGAINGTDYNHTVSVVSTDNNPYTIVTVYASEYDASKLRDLGEWLIEDMNSYLDSYNSSYGTTYVLDDLLYRGSGMTAFDDLNPGYYVAVALGITSKGEVSGLYAVSKTFEIKEETPTSLYSAWLGDWVINGDNNVANDVVIARNVANKSINLIGLMGLPFYIAADYSTERNDIIFYAQMVEQGYQFSDGTVADILLVGLDKDGKFYTLGNGSYDIAIAGVIEGGQRAIVRYGVNVADYPKFVAMMLIAQVGNSYYSLDTKEGTTIPAFNVMATIDVPTATATTLAVEGVAKNYRNGFKKLSPSLKLGKSISHLRRR